MNKIRVAKNNVCRIIILKKNSSKLTCVPFNRNMSSEARVEKGIKEPHAHDVLSGRGNFVNFHPGNGYFRSLVQKYKVDYLNCPKQQKGKFSQLIVDQVRARKPHGLFLKQDPETKLWNEIEKKKALDKTRQALREGAPELLKELSNSNMEKGKEISPLNEENETSLPDLVPITDSPEIGVPYSITGRFPMSQRYQSQSSEAMWDQKTPDYIIDPVNIYTDEYSFHQPLVKEESLQLESIFQLKSNGSSKQLRGSSIMSCSLGDITEASLSQVFEESLRVSDLAPVRETNSIRQRSVTDIADISVASPNCSSMFESNNISSLNFDLSDSLIMGSS